MQNQRIANQILALRSFRTLSLVPSSHAPSRSDQSGCQISQLPPAMLISVTHCVLRRSTEEVRIGSIVQIFAEHALLPLPGVDGRKSR
jgi:hypothetical protein